MVGSDLSDDDAYSTQLEGKKLKKRGVVIDGQFIEIDDESPAIGQSTEKKTAQYFSGREYTQGESEEEREERLKRELAAIKRQQREDLLNQQNLKKDELVREPNKVLDRIEQGVMMSQNRGKPLNELEFKHDGTEVSREKAELREHPNQDKKNDLAAAYVALGDNVKNMDFKNQITPDLGEQQKYSLESSVPATKLADVRDKEKSQGVEV